VQIIGSILVALAIVAVTIALVTARLGPNAERDDSRERDRIEREFDRDNSGPGNSEDRDRREDR
jgi:hypothetical protein